MFVESKASVSVLDRDQLREVTLDDPALMRDVLRALVDDTARQLVLLHEAVTRADARETIRLAHYAKGACATVGAQSSAVLFEQIERNAAHGNFENCRVSLDRVEGEIDKLRREAGGAQHHTATRKP